MEKQIIEALEKEVVRLKNRLISCKVSLESRIVDQEILSTQIKLRLRADDWESDEIDFSCLHRTELMQAEQSYMNARREYLTVLGVLEQLEKLVAAKEVENV